MFGPHPGSPSATEAAAEPPPPAEPQGQQGTDDQPGAVTAPAPAVALPPPLPPSAGVIPRAVHDLFAAIAALSPPGAPPSVSVRVALTVVEVRAPLACPPAAAALLLLSCRS